MIATALMTYKGLNILKVIGRSKPGVRRVPVGLGGTKNININHPPSCEQVSMR